MGLQVGEVIQNKYRIARLLGQGGMGAVFEGENLAIKRRVAIKVLHGALASQQGVVERFEREAQAAGRIGNDHILEVLDLGHLPDGDRYMVMEYLEGETLEQRLERTHRLEPVQLYPLVRQLLAGLTAAHSAGIIHRDLKPDNVFIVREKAGTADFIKIIDFGISKFTSLGGDMKMTATGAVMGTPYFMSPEQAKGSRDSDARSDLYAVGVILFKAVTGRVPFDAATFNELLFKIVLSDTPKASSLVENLDPGFESIIQRAMAKDPSARFQTAREFISAIDNWYARGTAMPATAGRPFQGHLPTELSSASQPHANPGMTAASPPQSRQPFGATPQPQHTRPSDPGSFGNPHNQHTSGLNQPTGHHPNYPGIVTNGSWSNTGLQPARNPRSSLWLGAGAATLLLGAGAFAFAFWNARTTAPLPPEPAASTHVVSPTQIHPEAPTQRPVPAPVVVVPIPTAAPAVAAPSAPLLPVVESRPESNARAGRRRTPEPPPRPLEVARPVPQPLPQPEVQPPPPPPPEPPKPRRAPDGLDLGY